MNKWKDWCHWEYCLRNSTSHTSPIMLITRKLTNDKRPIVDFRLLNTRILRKKYVNTTDERGIKHIGQFKM